jgi:hypothetical protein
LPGSSITTKNTFLRMCVPLANKINLKKIFRISFQISYWNKFKCRVLFSLNSSFHWICTFEESEVNLTFSHHSKMIP